MSKAFWSKERTEEALRLRAQGYSASQIAVKLGNGCTRNGVLGMFHRVRIGEVHVVGDPALREAAGMVGKGKQAVIAVAQAIATMRKPAPAMRTPAPAKRARKPKVAPPAPVAPAAAPSAPVSNFPFAPVLWAQRRRDQCAFVLTDPLHCRDDFMGKMLVCGAPTHNAESSWCTHHHKSFLQPMSDYQRKKKLREQTERKENYGLRDAVRRLNNA